MIQAFLTGSADPAFSESIGIRRPEGSVNDMKAFGNEDSLKGFAERAVIVVDQETKGAAFIGQIPNQLACLLSNPELMGMGGDAREMDAART